MMLMRILEEEKPTHMLVAFDAGKKQRSVTKRIVSIKEDVKRLRLNYQSNSRLFVRCSMHFNVPRYELEIMKRMTLWNASERSE